MDTNPGQFGEDTVSNQFGDEESHDTSQRDSEKSRDTENSRNESEEEWERGIGARDMGISCFWHFDSDEIEAKYDGAEGRGDTVADALEDLSEELRRSD